MICGSGYIFIQFTVEKRKTMAKLKPDFEEVIPLKMIFELNFVINYMWCWGLRFKNVRLFSVLLRNNFLS
jgi:hypothetical protein